MQEPWQFQPKPENQKGVSDVMEEVEVIVCDTCGARGSQSELIICNKCYAGAEHIDCMRNDERSKLKAKVEVYKDWTCQECMPREGTNKLVEDEVEVATRRKKGPLSTKSTTYDSSKVSKLKSIVVQSSTIKSHVLLTAKSMRKSKGSPLCDDSSSKQVKKAKTKSLKEIDFPVAKSESDTLFSRHIVIPEVDITWRGKFQIYNTNWVVRILDGIQAHLSTCASTEVLEVVKRLPQSLIVLDELPRLRIWPSQIIGNQLTEGNIALYFFASDNDSYRCYEHVMNYMIKNDLALKGELDETELLIFPSNILPEKSQRWNQMCFFWGLFKGQKTNSLVTTPASNLLKLENGDVKKCLPFDLNADPPDEDDSIAVNEIPEFDNRCGLEILADAIPLLHEDNSNDKAAETNAKHLSIDLNVSLWPDNHFV